MKFRFFGIACVGLALSLSACSTEVQDSESSEEALTTKATVLGTSTAAEAAAQFAPLYEAALGEFLANDKAKLVTVKWVSDNAQLGELGDITLEILAELGQKSAAPKTLKAASVKWAEKKLLAFQNSKKVIPDTASLKVQSVAFLLWDAVEVSNQINAFKRAENPTGIDLKTLPDLFAKVRANSTLDRHFYLPVKFNRVPTAAEVQRALIKGKVTLDSSGAKAIASFWSSGEGPQGDAAFKPLASIFNKNSISARYFFTASGDNWSRQILIVVDQHDQAYGVELGYSE